MNLLNAQQIFDKNDLITKQIAVPEWGGDVLVQTLTGLERDEFESGIVSSGADDDKKTRMRNIRARLVSMSIVDEEGTRLFGESDIEKLGAKSAKALDRIFDVASKLSGISSDDVDDLSKNLKGDPGAD